MPNTGFVRFSTVDSSNGFDVVTNPADPITSSPSNLIGSNTGKAIENRTFRHVTLSGLDLNIPANSSIDGIEYKFTARNQSVGLNYRISASLFLGDTQGTIHENRPGNGNNPLVSSYTEYKYGSLTTTEDLTGLNASNIENLKLKIETGVVMQLTALDISGSVDSPAIKIYYTPFGDPPSNYLVSDYKRFKVLDEGGGWSVGDPNSFKDGQESAVVYVSASSQGAYAILSDPEDFGVPSNATVTGLEFGLILIANNAQPLTSNQIWKGSLALASLEKSDLTDTFFTIEPNTTENTATFYTTGSYLSTFGLDLTPSNLGDLRMGFVFDTAGRSTLIGAAYGEEGDGIGAFANPSPAVRVHYLLPAPASKALPGPSFISSNIDLTNFRGLGNRVSILQSPPNSEDLFGFTSTIVVEGDNSSQATDSVFGDAANFGKLGLNRGGGTGISSDTGLLDTSKAPLSVRKGFRGL